MKFGTSWNTKLQIEIILLKRYTKSNGYLLKMSDLYD